MTVDSSAAQLRTSIANCLIAFALGNLDGEEAALDIVEVIALRMPAATDEDVGVVGFYVRANLLAMRRRSVSYCHVLYRLAEAAAMARLGPVALKRSIEAGLEDLLR